MKLRISAVLACFTLVIFELLGVVLAQSAAPNLIAKCSGLDFEKLKAIKSEAIKKWSKEEFEKRSSKIKSDTFEVPEFFWGVDIELIKHKKQNGSDCEFGYWEVIFEESDSSKVCELRVKTMKPYAIGCCPQKKCDRRSPMGWMLELFERSELKDEKERRHSLLELVDPKLGIEISDNEYSDDGEQISKHYSFGEIQRNPKILETFWQPAVEDLSCDQKIVNEKVDCFVGRSGYFYKYTWVMKQDSAKLLSRAYVDSGE